MNVRSALLTTLVAATLLAGVGCRQAPLPGMAQATGQSRIEAQARGLLVAEGNQVELLVDGPAIFASMHAAIAGARDSIQLHAYQLGGETGMRLVNALVEKHQQGVKVQVLIDAHRGGGGSGREMMEQCIGALEKAGVPFKDFKMAGMPKGPTWVSKLGALDHSKLLVVDGRIGFLGGMNFYDHGALNHDYMIKITGPGATLLGEMNNADYAHTDRRAAPIPLTVAPQAGTSRIEIAQNSPRASNIRSLITRHINQAQHSVYVEVLFLDDDMIIDALVSAKERGVDVRVILDPLDWGSHVPELERVPFDGIPNWAAVQDMIDAKIPVYWYSRRDPHENLHAKIASIDERYLLVGSANYTYRALDINRETYAAVDAPEAARNFNQVFMADEGRAKPIEALSPWQRRLAALFERVKRGIYKPRPEDAPPAQT